MDNIMWKTIPGFEAYEVSADGEVRSKDRSESYTWRGGDYIRSYKGRVLRQTVNKNNGYAYIHLGRGSIYTVHRLVAWAFIGPQKDGDVVRHRDGKKLNNGVTNLMYGSGAENYSDAVGHGTMTVGEKHYNCVLTEETVRELRRRCAAGEAVSKVATELGVKYQNALAIKNRKTWRWLSED